MRDRTTLPISMRPNICKARPMGQKVNEPVMEGVIDPKHTRIPTNLSAPPEIDKIENPPPAETNAPTEEVIKITKKRPRKKRE